MTTATADIMPPFYPNLEDNAHCLQEAAKMAVEYFQNDFVKPFKFYDHITGKSRRYRYTWPLQLTLELARRKYDIVFVDALNLRKLARDPYATMVEAYGQSVADDQMAHSNIDKVKRDALALVNNRKVNFKCRIPTFEDISELLNAGYLVICNVNARTLDQREGYSGHFVLVYDAGRSPDRLFVHNPGLPARERQEVPRGLFEKAWAYPREEYKNILALKK
jgi:hypothetical protein